MLNKRITSTIITTALIGLASTSSANAREQIRAVGSSTVYPFITVVAEEFGHNTHFKTPIIEPTGTGGGFNMFCSGIGEEFPDLANASRPIEASERELCTKNGVDKITEVTFGYDGIVLANSTEGPHYKFTRRQLFMALARKVPVNGKLVTNPFKTWKEIDPSFPDIKIEVYGPPPTSGTRDAFAELVLEPVCKEMAEFISAYPNAKERAKACHMLREDGHFIEAGENDNLIVQKLAANEHALGIFGFSFLDQNAGTVQGATIEGVPPTYENIADRHYPISRPLFVYVKNAHTSLVPGLRDFVSELIGERAAGEDGYLSLRGLVPLPEEKRKEIQATVSSELKSEE